MVICLERGADCLHTVQPMPLPSPKTIISCHSKVQNGLSFLEPAYPDCPGEDAIKVVFIFCLFSL